MTRENNRGPLLIGTTLGGTYRILDFIGEGGMGCVYQVEHLMMTKVMALKVLRPEQVSEAVWKRFRTEAQAIARLNHPNVVRIYDMSQTEDGLPYYTMDLLLGQSLDQYLRQCERMPVAEALPVFRQICSGLAYAHDHGIIHRDIKPGNIMLIANAGGNQSTPVVKIVDFGIAKLSARDGSDNQGLTRPGEVFGSPLYMSPEQCSGKAIDFRTDMYSLGVTMFQALTGKAPLLGKSAIETTQLHLTVVPPHLVDVADDIDFPPALEAIVARLLAKSKEARYRSMADVARALLALEKGQTNISPETAISSRQSENHDLNNDLNHGTVNDTSSDTIVGHGARKLFASIGSALVFVSLISMAAWYFSGQKRLNKATTAEQRPDIQAKDLQKLFPAQGPGGADENEAVLSAASDRAAINFLKTRTAPYSCLVINGGKKMIKFDFPTDFSLGMFSFSDPGNIKERLHLQAKGQIMVPLNAEAKFDVGPVILAHPNLLKFFQPKDLHWLSFAKVEGGNAALFAQLATMRGLRQIDFRGGDVGTYELNWLDKFTVVEAINLNGANIDSLAFSKSKILQRLTSVEIDHMVNITPVLRAIQGSEKVAVVNINYTNPSAEDIKLLTTFPFLWKLQCNGNDISDGQLAQLAQAKNLTVLSIDFCTKLTDKAIDILPEFKNLKELSLPDHLASDRNEAILHARMPQLKSFL